MFRIAVVGAGPAGCSATSRLLKMAKVKEVNLFDRSLVPWGLLRTGVAPDHPEVKHTAASWTHIGSDPKMNFYGGVNIGNSNGTFNWTKNQLSLSDLVETHDAVLLSNGAYKSRRLNLLKSSKIISAQNFVGAYNNDPYFTERLKFGGKFGIVGGGNVALDVARLLLNFTDETISKSDISSEFHANLSSTTEVHFFIRRSPFDLPCTTRELRELLTIPGVQLKLSGLDGVPLIEMDQYKKLQKSRDLASRKMKRLLKLLAEKEKSDLSKSIDSSTKLVKFHFHHKPKEIADQNGLDVLLESTTGKGEKRINLDFLIESLGYEPTPVDIITDIDKSTGRAKFQEENIYLAGWALSGAKGVVGDSTESARTAVERLGICILFWSGNSLLHEEIIVLQLFIIYDGK